MLQITFVIPQAEVDYLQRFAFEMESQKRVVKELITDNQDNPAILDTPTFKKYHDMYKESAASFEIARDAIGAKFVPPVLQQKGSDTTWTLSYIDRRMIITYKNNDFDQNYDTIEFSGVEAIDIEVIDAGANKSPCSCNGGNC